MWLSRLAVACLFPVTLLGNVSNKYEYELQEEVRALDRADRAKHHVRHRQHRHHHRSFLHRKRAGLFMQSPTDPVFDAASHDQFPEEFLPRRHPAVTRKFGYMKQAIDDLKDKQRTAAQVRETYETEVNTAIRHMNEVQAIEIAIARTKAAEREEETKLHRLADDRLRLDNTHHHLVSSLHHIMDPKIEFAQSRLKQREKKLKGLEEKATQWKKKRDQFHAASIAMIEERHASQKRLEEATAAEAKMHEERLLAEKQLSTVKSNVNYNVEGYRIALAKSRAATSKEERGKQATHEAVMSVKRLSNILNMEQRRVDESMSIGKDRVQGKIRELDSMKEQFAAKLTQLMQAYGQWERTHQNWGHHLAQSKEMTHSASMEYAEHQKLILDAAQAKVAYDAEKDNDWAWDEWPGGAYDVGGSPPTSA